MGRVKRVPVVMQMEALECGAASLGMVLAYWKKWSPLERLRIDCGVSRDGSNALNILKAARKYGMVAKGFRMEVERLRKVEAPAILHWNFCHFVVFNGFKGDKVSLNDPARGRVLVDMEEFNRSFTGIVLTFQPGPEFKSSGRRASVLSFVCERMKSAKAALLFTFLTGLLMAFVGLISPVFSQIFMDDILSGKNPDWFPFFIGMYAVLVMFQFLVQLVQGFRWVVYQARLSIEANASFMWHVLHLPISFFQQRFAGDLVIRQQSNQTCASNLVQKIAPAVVDISLLVIYLIVMSRYSWPLTAVGVTVAVLSVISPLLSSVPAFLSAAISIVSFPLLSACSHSFLFSISHSALLFTVISMVSVWLSTNVYDDMERLMYSGCSSALQLIMAAAVRIYNNACRVFIF